MQHALEVTPKDHGTAKTQVSEPHFIFLINLFTMMSFRPSLKITIDGLLLGVTVGNLSSVAGRVSSENAGTVETQADVSSGCWLLCTHWFTPNILVTPNLALELDFAHGES